MFKTIKTAEQTYTENNETLMESIRIGIDSHIENTAKSKGYNSAAHLASYVASNVPTWQTEAKIFIAWRDSVWVSIFDKLSAIQAGSSPAPTSVDEVISTLPKIIW